MKVSIIIPIYNVAPYIGECINSVIAQTYQGQIECILVDDCGTDESITICEHRINEYHGTIEFKILHHEHNRGLSAARNTGIEAATGEYIYFLDSDDWIIPECLELLANAAQKHSGCELVQGSTKVFDPKYCILSLLDRNDLPEFTADEVWIKKNLLNPNIIPVTAWNKLISKRLISSNRIYFLEGIIHEDELWIFMLAKYLKSICFVWTDTYIYRIRENSIMNTCSENSIISKIAITKEMINHIDEFCQNEQINIIKKRINSFYFQHPNIEKQKPQLVKLKQNLAAKASFPLSLKLHLWCFLSRLDKGKKSLGYYIICHMSRTDKTVYILRDIFSIVLHKAMRIRQKTYYSVK